MGDLYFNGTKLAGGKQVKFNGTNMANVYFNGTKVWTAYIPSLQAYTSSATYTIDDSETSIQWKISGGGGGGGGNLCTSGTQAGGAGGATTITVKDSSGNVRATLGTAAGGAGGGIGAASSQGHTKDFAIPSGFTNPPWSSLISDGGQQGGGEENCPSGGVGDRGAHASGTYTINNDGNDATLTITIGGAGAAGQRGENVQPSAGVGGAASILGVQG